jgi:hypothetical protein
MRHLQQDRSRRTDRHSFGYRPADRQLPVVEPLPVAEDVDAEFCVPLFISDKNGEPDPNEYLAQPLRPRRASSVTAKILAAVCAASIAAVLSGWFSSNGARNFFQASFADLIPAPLAATPPVAPSLAMPAAANAAPSPAPLQGPIVAKADVGVVPGGSNSPAQSLGPMPAVVEAPNPPPVVHHLSASDIAADLKRADDLIASGDIAAARLVLRPAAQSEDANAALKLAGTYDPDILGQLGVHGIAADPAKAQEWYEKARKFGAGGAAPRLEALASRRH